MVTAASEMELFLPKSYDIFWSLVILIIVAVFFYKFFLPKFQAVFDERAAKIEGGIAKAEQAQKDADEAKAKYEAQLSKARVEASKIRDDARTEASHIIADARTRAENDAAQITATAQRSIESQQQQALVSLKGEVGVLATALAGKILGSKLENDDVQSSMIDQMIADLDSDKKLSKPSRKGGDQCEEKHRVSQTAYRVTRWPPSCVTAVRTHGVSGTNCSRSPARLTTISSLNVPSPTRRAQSKTRLR